MLQNKTESVMDTKTTTEQPLPQGVEIDPSAALTLDEMFQPGLWEEPFLTSPQLDDSPEETPLIDTPLDGMDISPMIGFEDDSFGMPLFGAEVAARKEVAEAVTDVNESFCELLKMLEATASNDDISQPDSDKVALPSLDSAMYTMPSTPSFAPATLFNDPVVNALSLSQVPVSSSSSTTPAAPCSRVTKPPPTGTRRHITPSSLVPLDAPTQPRQYVTPSATSRKVIPSAFVKAQKRQRSEMPEDEEEEIDISHLDPNTEAAIEAKRRQNTLAARRSRQRKLEHVRELEETVQNITQDRDMWMQRAYQAEEKLRVHGIEP